MPIYFNLWNTKRCPPRIYIYGTDCDQHRLFITSHPKRRNTIQCHSDIIDHPNHNTETLSLKIRHHKSAIWWALKQKNFNAESTFNDVFQSLKKRGKK